MKKIILIFALYFIAINVIASSEKNIENPRIRELKDYALCGCLYYEFSEDSIFKNEGTPTAIIEFGSWGLDVYRYISIMVEKYIDTVKYEAYDNSSLKILKCIELYHSNYLDSIANNILLHNGLVNDSLIKDYFKNKNLKDK